LERQSDSFTLRSRAQTYRLPQPFPFALGVPKKDRPSAYLSLRHHLTQIARPLPRPFLSPVASHHHITRCVTAAHTSMLPRFQALRAPPISPQVGVVVRRQPGVATAASAARNRGCGGVTTVTVFSARSREKGLELRVNKLRGACGDPRVPVGWAPGQAGQRSNSGSLSGRATSLPSTINPLTLAVSAVRKSKLTLHLPVPSSAVKFTWMNRNLEETLTLDLKP